jgi:hypothetical protein
MVDQARVDPPPLLWQSKNLNSLVRHDGEKKEQPVDENRDIRLLSFSEGGSTSP